VVCQLSVFYPRGVTPTSKLVCVFPLPDGDARKTQRFILVRVGEGPTSSGGDVFYYVAPKCLYRGEYKPVSLKILSPRWKRCMVVILRVLSYVFLSQPPLL